MRLSDIHRVESLRRELEMLTKRVPVDGEGLPRWLTIEGGRYTVTRSGLTVLETCVEDFGRVLATWIAGRADAIRLELRSLGVDPET